MIFSKKYFLLVSIFWVGVLPRLSADRETHPTFAAAKSDVAPTIDGIINEDEWKQATVIDNFTQILPKTGQAPSEKTLIHVMFDQQNLYIAARCFDSQASTIAANQMQREADSDITDDSFMIVFDPFGDARNGYYFGVSAGGDKREALLISGKDIDTRWDTLWYGKSSVDEKGWSAEIQIPFKSISLKQGLTEWSVNFQRLMNRNSEVIRWSGKSIDQTISNLIHAGTMTDLKGISQGIGLTVEPYGLVLANINNADVLFKPGFTASYKITPATTAQLTVNTDFAEAEVDQQIVNLSRFPIFFPEKRAFFLQDETIFAFGGISQSPLPFYSRRIGIVKGQKKDIFAGLKVTGREGIFNFGILDVQMNDDPDLGSKNLSAARVAANIFDQSNVGVIVTHGDPSTTGKNSVIGADFAYRNSHVFDDKTIDARACAMVSFSEKGPANARFSSGTDEDDMAFGVRGSYPNDKLHLDLYAARYGKYFYPALGFISRPGTWEIVPQTRYRWRFDGYLRRFDLQAGANLFLELDGSLQSLDLWIPGLELENESGDIFYSEYKLKLDNLKEPFEVANGVVIPAGNYLFHVWSAGLYTTQNRAFFAGTNLEVGTYYNGIQLQPTIEVGLRPSRHFLFGASYNYLYRNPPSGLVEAHIVGAKANFVVTPELSFSNLFQFDSITKVANLNSTFRYELSPGQIAYLVLNQKFQTGDSSESPVFDGQALLKLGMTIVF